MCSYRLEKQLPGSCTKVHLFEKVLFTLQTRVCTKIPTDIPNLDLPTGDCRLKLIARKHIHANAIFYCFRKYMFHKYVPHHIPLGNKTLARTYLYFTH